MFNLKRLLTRRVNIDVRNAVWLIVPDGSALQPYYGTEAIGSLMPHGRFRYSLV